MHSKYNKITKHKNYFLFLGLFSISFLIIDNSPSFFDLLQPDSDGYLSGDQSRTIVYHYILKISENLNLDIVYLQKILLSLSIVSLLFFLKEQKVNNYILVIFFLLINLNYFYTSFSKTILPESIFFSLINFAIINLFHLKRFLSFISFGLLLGFIYSIKPIGMVISVWMIFFSFLFNRNIKNFFLIGLFFLIPILVESYLFYLKNDQRDTILKYSVVGKLFLLSGQKNFQINKYPDNLHVLLSKTKDEFTKVHNFLDDIEDKLLQKELLSDFEVLAQFQTFDLDQVKNLDFDKEILYTNYKQLAYLILKNNFREYFSLSIDHYIGNWSIGSKVRFLHNPNTKDEIPMYNELLKTSGKMNTPDLRLIIMAQVFFLILFLTLILKTLMLLYELFQKNIKSIELHDLFYITISQIYLLSISFTNVSTPRYLMTIYPILIIILLSLVNLFFNQQKKI